MLRESGPRGSASDRQLGGLIKPWPLDLVYVFVLLSTIYCSRIREEVEKVLNKFSLVMPMGGRNQLQYENNIKIVCFSVGSSIDSVNFWNKYVI